MIKNPADREKEVEKIAESFKKALILWLMEGKAGKICLEVNTGQGVVSDSKLKTERNLF